MTQRSIGSAVVADNRRVARDTVVLRLDFPLNDAVRAGQFAMLHPLRAGCLLPRPFSILSSDCDGFEVLVKRVGKGSEALADLDPGDEIRVLAPLGNGFDAERLSRTPTILVAGGVGIVPLHMLAKSLKDRSAPADRLIFGAQTPADLPRELFSDGSWQLWVEEGANGDLQQGRVTAGLSRALEEFTEAAVVTCGPTPMMRAVAEMASYAGRQVWVCLEEQMGCGSGVCRSCVLPSTPPTRMLTVCKDGPVFALEDIDFLSSAEIAL
jgi:dihydroorotate dehydrogenase electron transfer subunit